MKVILSSEISIHLHKGSILILLPYNRRLCLSYLVILFLFILSSCAAGKIERHPTSSNGVYYGVASWYGKEFHDKPTASGVKYDMYGLSAAHRTLPLGTRAMVRNLRNGKEVEVVINDRGPFVDGRLIDLSFGAAERLGMVDDGLVPVRLEVIGRDPLYIKKAEVLDSGTGKFTIQVGSFSEILNARRLKTALGWKYENVYIKKFSIGGGSFYRVRVGSFVNRNSALHIANELAEEGYNVWVTRGEQ